MRAPDVSAGTGEASVQRTRLIELNGSRDGPIDRGESNDLLQVRRLSALLAQSTDVQGPDQDVVAYVMEQLLPLGDSVEFSMMALAAAQ